MERKSQSASTRLIVRLTPDIWRIIFYRFCQLLEQINPDAPLLGTGSRPADDPVRFLPWPGMGFPVSELKTVDWGDAHSPLPPAIRTTFLGLYGVDSPLPGCYLDDIVQQRDGHEATAAFLDIFNHRIMTQYYRIWRRYAYPTTFKAGGADVISQCLLGLVGLGLPGSTDHIATPASRFLALLGAMRLPTRNAAGICALVNLLAPDTQAQVTQHDPVKAPKACGGLGRERVTLSTQAALGKTGRGACSRVWVALATDDQDEFEKWLPGGQLHRDLLALMRVYLGYRSDARLTLSIPARLLPAPRLGTRRVQLGRNGMLRRKTADADAGAQPITLRLGCYAGLSTAGPDLGGPGIAGPGIAAHSNALPLPAQRGNYRFI